jgi:hypothetical protein
MMQMPMQMAQQAAQIPMQLAAMAAAIPQAVVQGLQSATDQAGQISDKNSKNDADRGEEGPRARDKHDDEQSDADQTSETPRSEAAPGPSSGERAPEPQSREATPPAPPAPKPAPTRPAGSSPETVL